MFITEAARPRHRHGNATLDSRAIADLFWSLADTRTDVRATIG